MENKWNSYCSQSLNCYSSTSFCLYSVKTSKISSVNLYITLLVTKTYITPASHYISFDVKTLNMKTINNLPFVFHSNKRKSYSSSSLSIDSSNDSSSSVFHLHTDPMIIRFRSIYSANDSLSKKLLGHKKMRISQIFF